MTTHTDHNVRRVLGIPVSWSGFTKPDARLRAFEPENPDLLVPRAFGIGWAPNLGAIAVRLGLLRPDDSVPDLVDHIPPTSVKALRLGPLVGATAVIIAGAYTARRHDQLPTNWGLTLRPTHWGSGATAMATPVMISAAAGVWAELANRRAKRHFASSSVDVAASADALGLQAMSMVLIAATARQAKNAQATRLWPIAGPATAPAVSTGVLVTTVRSALRRLDHKLRRDKRGSSTS